MKPGVSLLKLRPRQTEKEEAEELAEQVYRNKTFLNIPMISGTGESYINYFEEATLLLKATDPKAKKPKKEKAKTPSQFRRAEAARVKAGNSVIIIDAVKPPAITVRKNPIHDLVLGHQMTIEPPVSMSILPVLVLQDDLTALSPVLLL